MMTLSPLDVAAEWVVKGMNIGIYYGLFFGRRDITRGNLTLAQYSFSLLKFTTKQSLVLGGVLGTWQCITQAARRASNKERAINYSIGSVPTLLLWHIPLGIPRGRLVSYSLGVGTVAYILGSMIIKKVS